jgi:ATP-dependent Clp protease ATP-binding subunit ClpC
LTIPIHLHHLLKNLYGRVLRFFQSVILLIITASTPNPNKEKNDTLSQEDKEILRGVVELMFEYFNDKAIKGVMLAQEEARRWGHNLVGSEHILIGLLAENTSIAATILKKMDVNLNQTRKLVENIGAKGSGFSPANLPFTPKVKVVFEQAFNEARSLGTNYISPEHILLAIAKQPENIAARLLVQQGVDLVQLGLQIRQKLTEQQPVAAGKEERAGRFTSTRQGQSLLSEFGKNLTNLAKEGKIDPVIGRTTEIERTIQILGRRTKNNPVLVGEPGVGKTAIAEGLARRIIEGEVPETLSERQVIALDLGLLIAGTKMRGEFEERITGIVKEVKETGNIILVIDEIHTLVGAGSLGGGMDAANILKPALARGELQCLGATTLDEYRQHIERDAALERRFQPVMVGEPSVEETIEILKGLQKTYEEYHKVKIADRAIEAAAKLADRYISDRFLPDKAIDLIDEAGSRTHLRYSMLKTVAHEEDLADKPIINPQALTPVVDEEEIAQIVSAWTGIPVNKLTEAETDILLNLEANLHERIIGQNEAVKAVSRAIRRARVGLAARDRPIASFIFSGPTGVGKTELAKALAKTIFGSEEAMIRIDMSELMESHTVSKLIGSPPGFVGYEEGGQLTEAVRRKPYTVLLFDEIEKAHPDVFNLLLQMLDDGHLTDAKGRKVSFKNTLIIMTSNIGSKAIEKGGTGLGFGTWENEGEAQYNQIRTLVNEELKQYFRPEFLNRLDEIIVFRQLIKTEVSQIADILLEEVVQRLKEQRDITLEVSDRFKEKIIAEGFEPKYGARPLRRAIMNLLEDSLAEAILSGQLEDGDRTIVDIDFDGVVKIAPIQQQVFEFAGSK